METFKEITAQIEMLRNQAETVRADEPKKMVEHSHGLMKDHGITGADLGFKVGSAARSEKSTLAKFMDPETRATWTGRGRKPKWIVGKDPTKYAI